MRCPSCDHDNSSERRFCGACGAALVVLCASCGATNESGEQFCGGCGARLTTKVSARAGVTPVPESQADLPAGERRQLTVLFCDLVDSTALAGQLDPEDWRAVAAQFQRSAAAAVTGFGGHVAKYLGDGLMVYFGWPEADEADAERAVRAGLAIVDAVRHVNRQVEAAHGFRLAVRVGMHTGPVVVGDAAGAGVDVFGDTPNVAARVQAAAEPDSVVITAATHRLVAGRFVVENRGAPPLKGVRDPITLYRVVKDSGVRSRLDAASVRGLTPFVGRRSERGLLFERWEQAQAGEGQIVLVTGEAGIGKSRLAQTLQEHLAGKPHTWLKCHGSAYHQNTPFHAAVEMLQQALGWADATSPEARLQALERSLQLTGVSASDAVPLVAPLLGLAVPDRYPSLHLPPEGQRRQLLATLAAWLVGLGRVRPVVVVVEDLQWVDHSTLELQALLVEQVASASVLLIYTARPEFRAPWPLLAHHTVITLNRLSQGDIRAMIAAVAARAALADEVVATLVTRTDGVPLFVEELTKAVLEARDSGSGRVVPGTLADSLTARLDRLGPAKEVAQVAALVGREFSYALLHAVSPLPETELRTALGRLTDAELLYPRGVPPEATYVFRHALVQDAAYASLLKSRRRELHLLVARVTTERFPVQAEAEPEFLARHYEAAGLMDEAVGQYQRAGNQAQERSAHEEAIIHFRKAITLAETSATAPERESREMRVQMALGASLMAVRGYAHAETEAAYERARRLCEAVGDRTQLASALGHLSTCYLGRGDTAQALEIAERLMEIAQETGRDTDLVLAHSQMLVAHYYQGKFASSLAHAERLIALYDPSRHRRFTPTGPAGAGAFAACCLAHLGYPDQALARARKAVELARSRAHPFTVAFTLYFKTVVDFLRRDAESLQATADELIAVSEAQGFPLWLGLGRQFRAAALVALGAGSSAGRELSDGLALVDGTGQRIGAPLMYAFRAEVQQAVGQPTEALRLVESGFAESRETGQPYWDAELHRLRGEILLRSGAESAANVAPLFRRAIEIARAQEARSFELRAATSLARLWRDQGKRADARDLLAPVYAWFTEGFDTRDLIEAKALLDELR